MGKKSGPEAPDYTAAAEKQGQSSRENIEQQTWANRPDTYTPWGSQTWDRSSQVDPTTGKSFNTWDQHINLSPEQQRAFDAQQNIQGGKSDLAQSMLGRMNSDFGPMTDWNKFKGYGDIEGAGDTRNRVEDETYAKYTDRLDDRFGKDNKSLQTELMNQGLSRGDEAYDSAMKDQGTKQTDAYQQAMHDSVMSGGEEAQRQFNMGLGGANYGNQVRQSQIAEEMQKRGWSLNEVNAILNGQQVGMPSMPGFNTAGAAQATQYSQAAGQQGQAAIDQYNAQQGGLQGMMGGAASLGSMAMMFSDRRLKKNIEPLFVDPQGIQWYKFNYLWSVLPHIGVMADEVAHIPNAVHTHFSGYKLVNYGALHG